MAPEASTVISVTEVATPGCGVVEVLVELVELVTELEVEEVAALLSTPSMFEIAAACDEASGVLVVLLDVDRLLVESVVRAGSRSDSRPLPDTVTVCV